MFVQNGSYKSTKIVLGEKQSFESVITFDAQFLRGFPKFTPPERIWEFLKVDAGLLRAVPNPPMWYQMRALIRYVGAYAYDPEGDGTVLFGEEVVDEPAAVAARRFTVDRLAIEKGSLGISQVVLDLFDVHEELRPRRVMVKDLHHRKIKVKAPKEGDPAAPKVPTRVYTKEEIATEISETMFREYSTAETCDMELRTLRMALNVTLHQMLFGILKVITVNETVLRHNVIYCKSFMEDGDLGLLKYISNKGMLTPEVADELAAQRVISVARGKMKRFINYH